MIDRRTQFGRGTVILGAALLAAGVVYLLQVMLVAQRVRELMAQNPAPVVALDGTVTLRRVTYYRFPGTQEAWVLAQLWLLWVLGVMAAGHPNRRVQAVKWLAAAVALTVLNTWTVRAWLHAHGVSALFSWSKP